MKKKWTKSILFCILLVSSLTAYSQNTIKGTVADETGLTIPGVNITVVGSAKTVSTDFDGKFEINVPANATLSLSFLGFDTQKIPVAGKNTINVILKSSSENLKEVVVIGYGSVKKADLTGSVSTIKTKVLEDIPTNSFEQVLQGRVAGLQVTTSQDPGSSSTVRIRGGSSLRGSNAPLVVLDGFPLGDAGDLKQVNVADIEKVDVLKDASASAIYGSRGANGVIIITTKSAKKGKTQILIQQQSTVSQFNSELNLWRDPVLMAQLSNEGRINGGQTPLYVGAKNSNGVYYPSIQELQSGSWPYFTKWDDVTFRNMPLGNNTIVSVNSGTDKTSFNLSGNYYSEEGVFVKDGYSKGGYNLRIKHDVFDNFTVRFSNIVSKGKRDSNGGLAYWRNPIFPVYDTNGDYFMIGQNDYTHPVAITNLRQNETKTIDVISSAALEWQIIPSLRLTSRLNYKYGSSVNDQYYPSKYTETGDFNNGAGYINNWEGQNFVSETFANYNKTFNKHDFGATAGYTYESYVSRSSGLGAFDFVNETLGNENMGAGNPQRNAVSNGKIETKLVSGIFRLNYGYDDKYLATVTGRSDGSSKFGRNNQWAFFPSGALSWKAHNETFIKNLKVFDELKFRLSYGISGNQGINPYQTLSRYGVSQYYDNGSWVSAIGPGYVVGTTGQDGIEKLWGGIPNPDLKWETTAQSDFGVDLSILKNRLHVVFDYYNKQTKDLLRERILTPSSGYDRIWVNDGKLSNKGFEVTLDGEIFKNQDWTISAQAVYSKNKNEIRSLGSVEQSGLNVDPNTGMQYEYSGNSLEQFRQFPNLLAIGQPVNVFYGYKVSGIVQNLQEGINAGLDGQLAQAGEFKYVDINGDGVVDTKDQTIIGNPNPDFMASLNLSVKYKQFDFSVFLNGVFGQDVLDTQAFNQPSNAPLRWTLDNPTNDYPSLRDGRTLKFSDWWVKDGSFVRIQNVTAGYTLKPVKSAFQSIRLYVNANNVYTFTKFKGYDPEVGTDGIYWGGYPRLSKWTFGLDLTF